MTRSLSSRGDLLVVRFAFAALRCLLLLLPFLLVIPEGDLLLSLSFSSHKTLSFRPKLLTASP